jgi:hypothetical protein
VTEGRSRFPLLNVIDCLLPSRSFAATNTVSKDFYFMQGTRMKAPVSPQ